MPDRNRVLPRRQLFQDSTTISARNLKIRRRHDCDVGNHPIVNVAAKSYESFVVEDDRLCRNPRIQRQLESFRGGKRVDVMPNVVLVRKQHRRANLQRRDIRNELLVSLIDHISLSGVRRCGARLRVNYRIGNRRSLSILHRHVQ